MTHMYIITLLSIHTAGGILGGLVGGLVTTSATSIIQLVVIILLIVYILYSRHKHKVYYYSVSVCPNSPISLCIVCDNYILV